jgi:hypothetical protein
LVQHDFGHIATYREEIGHATDVDAKDLADTSEWFY